MPVAESACGLQDSAALWSIGAASSAAVVLCACDALVAGLDSPSLRILAGLTRAEADRDVAEILPAALAELGLTFHPPGSRGGQEAAARALAAEAVAGLLTPRDLAVAIHRHFGHNLLPLAERLAGFDDEYDLGAYGTRTPEQIDRDVMTEARRLTQRSAGRPDRLSVQRQRTRALPGQNVRVSDVSEGSRALTAGLIVDGARAADPVISPDGRWVAWTTSSPARHERQVSELWLAPVGSVGEGAAPVRLTDGSERVRLPRWSPDSAWLFYVADGEVRRQRITAGGPAEGAGTVLRWQGEISGLAPLAGGRLVAVVAGDEQTDDDERRLAERDDAMAWSERAARQHWLWHRLRLLDLASGELTVVACLAGRHVVGMVQRPDGGPLAVMSWDCPEYEPGAFTSRLHLVDLDEGTAADRGRLGFEERSPAWWQGADGWHVAWLAAPPSGCGTVVLDVAVSADGTAAAGPHDLTAGMTACPAGLVQVTGGPPVALFAEGLDTALYRLDPAGPSFRRVTGWTGRAAALSASDGAAAIAVLASTAHAPRDVSAGPPDGLVRVSDTRPELRGIAWGTQERLSWRAPDGLELDGLLVLPPGLGRADGPFPVVTMVHGGPYDRWADELMLAWVWWGQWLAAAGFAVFHPNPRGSQGHGQAFASMVARAVGQDEWTDILAGLDALVADGVADPARLGIAGWSHGGFMAAWAVTQTGRFRAAVMGAGIADWAMQVGAGEQGRAEADLCGSFGWEGPGPHRHDQLSPISYAAKVTTPVLILHGEDDTNVPAGQATYFHRALTQFGAEHDLVIYPGEDHLFTERAHQIDVLERARSWFTRWLGGPADG